MKNLTLVKFGGSLITNKTRPFSVRLGVIKRLCQEVHEVRSTSKNVLIIGHGGGSFPHVPAKKYKIHEGLIDEASLRGIAEVQDAAAKLNRIVVREFLQVEENAISFSPSSFATTYEGQIRQSYIEPILRSLHLGLLPIVYGDVVFDEKKGCSILSTEKILNFLALKLQVHYESVKMIHCGITDGVYDAHGSTVKEITPRSFVKIRSDLGMSAGIDVTGGMLHKVKEALEVAGSGIFSLIINGAKRDELKNALLESNFHGTLIKKNGKVK